MIIPLRYSVILLLLAVIVFMHPFLAVNKPIDAKVLVIEGWIPQASLKYAIEVFKNQPYELILTNGGKLKDTNKNQSTKTYAGLCKDNLIRMGIDENLIIAIPTKNVSSKRTLSYAQSTIDWLRNNRQSTHAVNILTLDAHARKTYVLFKKVSKKQIGIGVISAPATGYNPFYWYFSVKGIGFVIKNFIGYLYALTL
ncbi:MAG: hypothetical protein GY874_02575 [Desulfobacteraceae bacterium]|nr:hypothetical protein [Desulfobacteraceae bacterium]